jgi:hypothetical protein
LACFRKRCASRPPRLLSWRRAGSPRRRTHNKCSKSTQAPFGAARGHLPRAAADRATGVLSPACAACRRRQTPTGARSGRAACRADRFRRPKQYIARNPYVTPSCFPTVPSPIFDDPGAFVLRLCSFLHGAQARAAQRCLRSSTWTRCSSSSTSSRAPPTSTWVRRSA